MTPKAGKEKLSAQCRGLTVKGLPCKMKAPAGSHFCHHHSSQTPEGQKSGKKSSQPYSYVHYSRAPIKEVYSAEQEKLPYPKPKGLWLSLPGYYSWPQFNKKEELFSLEKTYRYGVKLRSGAKILRIKTLEQARDFGRNYGQEAELTRKTPRRKSEKAEAEASAEKAEDIKFTSIHWEKVARDYQGIILAPYHRAAALKIGWELGWYLSFDAASGCIWDAEAVEELVYLGRGV